MSVYLQVLLVALGGSFGAVLRWGLQQGLYLVVPTFPLGTMMVNAIGSFLAGLALAQVGPGARELVLVGFLGALTTMAGFALDLCLLVEQERYLAVVLHWSVGAIVSVLLCMLGLSLSQKLIG